MSADTARRGLRYPGTERFALSAPFPAPRLQPVEASGGVRSPRHLVESPTCPASGVQRLVPSARCAGLRATLSVPDTKCPDAKSSSVSRCCARPASPHNGDARPGCCGFRFAASACRRTDALRIPRACALRLLCGARAAAQNGLSPSLGARVAPSFSPLGPPHKARCAQCLVLRALAGSWSLIPDAQA